MVARIETKNRMDGLTLLSDQNILRHARPTEAILVRQRQRLRYNVRDSNALKPAWPLLYFMVIDGESSKILTAPKCAQKRRQDHAFR